MFDSIKDACKDLGADGHVLNQEELVDFIMGDLVKYQWTSQLLPREGNFMENTMLATHILIPQYVTICNVSIRILEPFILCFLVNTQVMER